MAKLDVPKSPRDRERRELRALGLSTRAVNVLAEAGVRFSRDLLSPDLPQRLEKVRYCPAQVVAEIAYVGDLLSEEWGLADARPPARSGSARAN